MVAAFTLMFLAAIAVFVLASSYIFLYAASNRTVSPESAKSTEQAALLNAQALITTLSPMLASSTSSPSVAIATALSRKPKGVIVQEIRYDNGTPSTLTLVGSASARDAINAFRQSLGQEALFTAVNVPVGDLLGTAGNNFTMSLSGTF